MEKENSYEKLVKTIFDKLKIDCNKYNEAYVKRRVNSRITSNNIPQDDYEAYVGLLHISPEEVRKLYETLTVNVTEFFRDMPVWEILRNKILPEIIKNKKKNYSTSLKIWSCGSSSGEEAYSLAILLRELIKTPEIIPRIHASDIDDVSIQKARLGIYDANSLKNILFTDYIDKYFRKIIIKGILKCEARQVIKSIVEFHCQDVLKTPPPIKDFDLILCRNVIIYMKPETKDNLMEKFASCLKKDGFLILGKSEVLFTIKSKHKFMVIDSEANAYTKKEEINS